MDEVTRTEAPGHEHQRIRAQLSRILEHPEFQATEKMRDFLRFVVEQTLAGKARHLKGFTIATEVFGRDEEFDAAHDPVVRIQAGRLRRALERYYLVAGMDDPVYIDIPKGGYVPRFRDTPLRSRNASNRSAATDKDPVACWPSVLVCSLEDLTGRTDLSYLASGLATELCMELANSGDLRVMLLVEDMGSVRSDPARPDFFVRGSVRAEGSMIKVVIQLVAAASGELLWSNSLKSELENDRLIGFQEKTAAVIATQIAGQHGAIFRALSDESREKPVAYGQNYEAILKGYSYHQRVDPESYELAFEALREAYELDRSCGLVCSMLALVYVDNLSLEYFDVGLTPLEEAKRLAREGVRLLPENQLSRVTLARVHLLDNDLEAGLQEIEAARSLAPDSVLWLDVIGYLSVLFGDWDRGEHLVRRAMELNPFHRTLTRYATWACRFRNGDYEQALEETRWLAGVGFFWYPLCRAATLGQLGRLQECRDAISELLQLKPDFQESGLRLIRHYVKFPELEDGILEGLAASGLTLKTAQS